MNEEVSALIEVAIALFNIPTSSFILHHLTLPTADHTYLMVTAQFNSFKLKRCD